MYKYNINILYRHKNVYCMNAHDVWSSTRVQSYIAIMNRLSMDSIVKLIDTIQQYILSSMCVSFTTTFIQ